MFKYVPNPKEFNPVKRGNMSVKKFSASLALFGLMMVFAVSGYALTPEEKEVQAKEKEVDELQKKIDEKKDELNGTSWEIELKPQYGGEMKIPNKDTLYFQDGKFKSAYTDSEGFSRTNYTIRLRESGPATFETMQSHNESEKGIVFWRGEWLDKAMTGTMVRKVPDKKGEGIVTESYYFSNTGFKEVPDTSESKEGETQSQFAAPQETPKTLVSAEQSSSPKKASEKKKKKGFWG